MRPYTIARSVRFMADAARRRPVPYRSVSPGFEGVYTGERSSSPIEQTEVVGVRETDDAGNVVFRWPAFPWTFPGQEDAWGEEIRHINQMQAELGPLDEATRQIRAHVGSLVPCDSGLPVTIDELLDAIGRGRLTEPTFATAAGAPACGGGKGRRSRCTRKACDASTPC